MERRKGTIGLDIDGTITDGRTLAPNTQKFLEELISSGWDLIFLTGRTFSFAYPVISGIKGNFKIIVQNGAAMISMPEKKVVQTSVLPIAILSKLNPFFRERDYGLLVESGADQQDVCYYCESDFSPKEREYLAFRNSLCPEKWENALNLEKIPVTHFAVGKYFAKKKESLELKEAIEKELEVRVTSIRDPFRKGYDLALINNAQTSKHQALEKSGFTRPLIGAGDDMNDLGLIDLADIKIVVEHAPQELLKKALLVSESPSKEGIIHALKEAIKLC